MRDAHATHTRSISCCRKNADNNNDNMDALKWQKTQHIVKTIYFIHLF